MDWAVIMAGGSGTRFWPESRQNHPKQFLNIFGSRTLLEQTFLRIKKVIPTERILVFTQQAKANFTAKLLGLPRSQVIGEPVGRNTAPCAVWAAMRILEKDPSAILGIFPSDHFIQNEKMFGRALRVAFWQAERESLPVTLGIRPDQPHTGYGYLEMGGKNIARQGIPIFRLKRFHEKPDLIRAQKYFRSKRFLWNAGIFVWQAGSLVNATKRFLPDLYRSISEISRGAASASKIKKVFSNIKGISIDYGLMEKMPGKIFTIPVSIGWNDVGSWAALRGLLPLGPDRNLSFGKTLLVESSGNIIKAKDRLITAVGLKDHIVVDTGDVILVCPLSEAESIRKIVLSLKQKKRTKYL